MTKEEIIKKFPFAGNSGECMSCAYFEICDKMLPGFIRPKNVVVHFKKKNKQFNKYI